jgi:CubicO group peptidase (beta-lactamase class C family)
MATATHRLRTSGFVWLSFFLLGFVAAAGCRGPEARRLETVTPESVGLSSEKLRAVHELLEENVRNEAVAGAVAIVARHGKVGYLDAVGMQDREAGKPMTPDAIFRICSMTKPITSVAVLMLEEEGKLSLDDPVSKFIPEFKGSQVAAGAGGAPGGKDGGVRLIPAERQITILHLLTHTSGIPYGFTARPNISASFRGLGIADGLSETGIDLAENARRIASAPLVHQPGTAWEYGLSTDVLGRVVEVASGLSLDEFFRARIFQPLGMKDTCFRLPADRRPRLAAVYQTGAGGKLERLPGGRVEKGALVYSDSYPHGGPGVYFSGGAGLVSTVPDYYRFLLMLRNGGELDGARLLRTATVERMTRSHTDGLKLAFTNHGDAFGLGFGVVTEAGRDFGLGSVGAYSWGGFYYTYFWVDPRKDLIGLVMAQLQPWDGRTLWDDFRKRADEAVKD